MELYRSLLDSLAATDAELLWKASHLHSRVGFRFDDEKKKESYYNRAVSLAQQALQADSTSAGAHFALAAAKGRMALISSARERVAASRAIKYHAEQALVYDSTHAKAAHLLGRWHFKAANLSFAEKMAANVLFGGMPEGASNEKAVKWYRRAIKYGDDNSILYYYDLARVYHEMGRDQEAIDACEKALQLPETMPDDPKLKQKARDLKRELS